MKSAQGFSAILIVIIGALVLGIGGMILSSNLPKGNITKQQKTEETVQTAPKEGLDIRINDSYFPVTGNTIAEVRNFLVNKGPELETGHKGVASCQMGYEWIPHVSSNKKLGQCRIDKLELLGKIECTYPKWDPPASASQEDIGKWNAYIEGVRQHEQEHIDIDKKWLNILYSELQKITNKPTCEEIREEVVRIGHEIIVKSNQEDLDFDLKTQHGEKQGVDLIP